MVFLKFFLNIRKGMTYRAFVASALILFVVQANYDLAPTSLSQSSPPILPLYSSKLDAGELHLCLTLSAIGKCARFKSTWPFPNKMYKFCITKNFAECFGSTKISENPIIYSILEDCVMNNCEPNSKIKVVHHRNAFIVRCLLECYNKHVTSPSDIIYMHNH
jgi:hypothetical protein